MLNKEKYREWSKIMLSLIKMTQELTDDEAEYIMLNFKIEFAKIKIEELEAKNRKWNKKLILIQLIVVQLLVKTNVGGTFQISNLKREIIIGFKISASTLVIQ